MLRVMPAAPTPSQLLAEVVLGRPLQDYVAEKRLTVPQWSWRLIAEQLRIDTDDKVDLSSEWLRRSYDSAVEALAAERAEASS